MNFTIRTDHISADALREVARLLIDITKIPGVAFNPDERTLDLAVDISPEALKNVAEYIVDITKIAGVVFESDASAP